MSRTQSQPSLFFILDNIRSAYNVGSLFRTADAAGVSKIYITGITPAPIDRFNRVRRDIAKVALGAEQTVPWEYIASLPVLVRRLRKEGVWIIALEQGEHAVDYKKVRLPKVAALILGNEVGGVSHTALRIADCIAEIPMQGKKESLNVSVAAGIAAFRLLKR